MEFKSIIKQIEKRRDAVGKERDKIDEMISELESLSESCDNAWHCLQEARDRLSEYV